VKKLTCTILAILLSAPSFAAEGLYAGISYISSELDSGISNINDVGGDGTISLDEDDHGWKLYVGLPVNENVAIEAHYADLGEFTIKSSANDEFDYLGSTWVQTTNNQVDRYDASSIGLGAVLSTQLSPSLKPFAKIGMHRWNQRISKDLGTSLSYEKDHKIDPFYGVGIDVKVTEDMSLRAEYERYEMFYDADVLSAGLLIRF